MHRSLWTIWLYLVFILLLISVTAMSAVPPFMNYQGRLTDDAGNPVDTTSDITFTIYDDYTGGSPLWSETHPSVTVTDGLFSVLLGTVVQIPPTVFDGSDRFLAIQLGDGPENEPRAPITSVAYALRSNYSDTAAYALAAPSSGSPWIVDGSSVLMEDTSFSAAVGMTYVPEGKKLSVQTNGTGINMAFTARNASGTAAAFSSGAVIAGWPGTPAAIWARAESGHDGGYFTSTGTGKGISIRSTGSESSLHSVNTSTGYSGRFIGGLGVKVEGDLETTGAFKLPTGASDGHILTSNASGVASWQEGPPASQWTLNGSSVDLNDDDVHLGIGPTIFSSNRKVQIRTTGTAPHTGLFVHNTTGAAAKFYCGTVQTVLQVPSAVYARTQIGGYAGHFSADGSGRALFGYTSGSGEAVYGSATGTGYAGYFAGTRGVLIDGPLEVINDVGIGVATPKGMLDVTDNASGVALHISNADRDITWTTGQSLQLGEWNGSSFVARMRITAEGNVGVNTTAPAGALHARGNSDGMALHLSAASGDISWPTNNTLNMGTWNGSVFDEHMRITAGGNVGIGVSSTPNILTVQQYSASDPIADSWGTYSSRRWKENIQPLQGAMDRVVQLQGVSYDWKETGEHDIGLIAEEVGQIVPEVVQFEENGVDARSVDYARLTALLIEAVKELKSDNEALKSRLEAVEKANSGN